MPSQASRHFLQLTEYVQQLIDIHAHLQSGRGRRYRQDSIHRAGVVLTVAAWESYVEAVIREAFVAISPPAGAPAHAVCVHRLAQVTANKQAADLNTPNAENIRRIMQDTVGFDPWSAWSWSAPRRRWASNQIVERLNSWLKIRHTVAHGSDLPQFNWIRSPQGRYRLNLVLLRECRSFFNHLVEQTDAGLGRFLAMAYPGVLTW